MYISLAFKDIPMYTILNILGIIALFSLNMAQARKKVTFLGKNSVQVMGFIEKGKEKSNSAIILAVFEMLFFSVCQYSFAGILNNIFGNILDTGPNYFGLLFFGPFIIIGGCILLGVDIFKQIDLLTTTYPLALFFAKLGCFFHGCCEGVECSFGLYNYDTKTVEFPTQLVESGLALVIFIFLLLYRKKAKEGTMLPTYLIIYSSTRFFSEFTRNDPNVIWNFKTYHLLCFIGIVLGIIELLIIKKYNDRIKTVLGKLYESMEIRLYRYAIENKIIRERPIVHHKKRNK